MIKVQSLKTTIIVQFAAILLPMVALVAYQAAENARRTSAVDGLVSLHGLALDAKERYAAFGNGAADAVDASELSKPALAALRESHDKFAELGRAADRPDLAGTAEGMNAMVRALEKDPSLTSLYVLRDQMAAARAVIARTQGEYDAKLDEAIRRSILESQRETLAVAVVLLLVLALTVWFVLRMIRYLSRPLGLAVSVADRIAEDRPVAEQEFDLPVDVGNLLRSLGRMHASLKRYRSEALEHQRGLEQKIEELKESQASLAEAQHLAQIGNWHWDVSAPLAHWSDEMYRILGATPGACAPTLDNFLALLEPDQRGPLKERVRALRKAPGSFPIEYRIRTPDGDERVLHGQVSSRRSGGEVVRLNGTIQDVTERKRAEEKIQRLAHYDSLTGLPNRQYFRDELEHTVARARRTGERLAAMFLDLDRFKRINDTFGHAAGDVLLSDVARRLNHCLRSSDYFGRESADTVPAAEAPTGQVARLGGDEFTVTLDSIRDPQAAAKVARRILSEMSKPFVVEGQELVITTSIGISIFPDDGSDADTLLKNADAAMYMAKGLGRNTYQFFARAMNTETLAKLALENELRRALELGQLVLHYQPKIDVRTGRMAGVEALMRWRHPRWGLVPPEKFIPMAEEIGLIVPMGEWALEEACRQLKVWETAGYGHLDMAVNLASPSFLEPDLITRVRGALRRHGVPPERLEIEVTESILMRDVERAMTTLRQLRELGAKISIDDFGTGYSSLSYLRRFPIDQLKIDRSFVKEITDDPDDAAISSAIISLGHSLKLEVVAEGVETLRQARVLIGQGCRMMQGFLFSPPLPVEELSLLLAHRTDFSRSVLEFLRAAPPTAELPPVDRVGSSPVAH